MTGPNATPQHADDEEFRYWSDRAEREAIAAIHACCRKARLAHQELTLLCIRRALSYIAPDDTA